MKQSNRATRHDNGLEWKDVTDCFSERERHWKGRYLELCEVAVDEIELSLFSCPDSDWEVYVNYGKMYGVSYARAENAVEHRNAMKMEIEAEYRKNGKTPSSAFINRFAVKYALDIMHAFF